MNLFVLNVERRKMKMPPHFRTRDDVINWAEKNLPATYKSVHRAFREGSIEFLGGFSQIGAGHNPGWIIKVISKFNIIHYIAIFCRGKMLLPWSGIIYDVPWKHWDGDKSNNPLYLGDFPKRYKELKNKEIENGC